MALSQRSLTGLLVAACLLLASSGLAGLRQENKSGRQAESPAVSGSSYIKKDLLPKLGPELAEVKRDPFRPVSGPAARSQARRTLPSESGPAKIKPASVLENLSLSCLGLVNSGTRRMALILVDGQAVTLAEGEELIPGIRLAIISAEEIVFRDNQGNSRKVRIKER
ncbi:MAG: hypothetical protein QME85_01395 [Candidatus Saccharicenans sp.]|nr:hypothetical protein [Candidatus Saccharicenans sp.]MDI6849665.1 hypothetical protein [Candidatus Saccharicenans sp.]